MLEALQYGFMRNASLAAILAGIACGIIGTYVVVKGIVFISGGIAHASFGGIGIGYFSGINPILGVIPFSIASALGIGIISKRSKLSEDTTIGIFWAMGMAIGIIFMAKAPGFNVDLMSYLFGNILLISKQNLYLLFSLDVIIIVFIIFLYK